MNFLSWPGALLLLFYSLFIAPRNPVYGVYSWGHLLAYTALIWLGLTLVLKLIAVLAQKHGLKKSLGKAPSADEEDPSLDDSSASA
jgi:hypothetical protein